uniref:receptor protein-tyrosine kinase n=1 Tax=Phallusia mammillata TaxID=59560 RepID=A0A6F9DCV0_9ASCI|nr:receptor tyrosine-protein kinase erbB-4 [Phallusia mammillata]
MRCFIYYGSGSYTMKHFLESFVLAGLLLQAYGQTGYPDESTICFGTNSGFSMGEDRIDHYSKMWRRYENCTIVKGNLEITGLEKQDLNVSFLQNIEEITGYLLIGLNYVKTLPLDKLRIIRGRELYDDKYSLIVTSNYNKEDPKQGMEYLRLQKLTEIVRGDILVRKNLLLCHTDTVDWMDMMNNASRKLKNWTAEIRSNAHDDLCQPCPSSCNGYCWKDLPALCQTRTNMICSKSCDGTRCRGPGRNDCCDKECAVGCTGPRSDNCMVCLHVNDSGSCELQCPPKHIYDSAAKQNVPNPKFRYNYHDQCVDKCPSNLLVELSGCVKSCRRGYHNDGNSTCVPCTPQSCEKECNGIGLHGGELADEKTVNSLNVHHFKDCKIINGNLIFHSYVFKGDNHSSLPPLTVEQVTEAFKSVREITGYLHIVSWPEELRDFSVFQNLEQIGGTDLVKDLASLVIQDSMSPVGPFYLKHIESLGFKSLKTILHGNIYIGFLRKLCYARLVNWSALLKDPKEHRSFHNGILLRSNKPNCDNISCDPSCLNGCWGSGADECVSCRNYSFEGTCLPECSFHLGIYTVEGNHGCAKCDSKCNSTCSGPGPYNCTSCKYYRDGDKCVSECPTDKWPDRVTGECMPCHNVCQIYEGDRICSGPNKTLGEGGCHRCEHVVASRTLDKFVCMPPDETCPDAHYLRSTVTAKYTCMPCYEGCRNCTGIAREDCLHAIGSTFLIPILVPIFVVLMVVIITLFLYNRRRKQLLKKRQHSMRVLGIDPQSAEEQYADPRVRLMEPMTPSGVAPNQAQLRIVKEAELRIGKILGSGAFGTVHKGYWIPDLAPRERVKVPVAIKVLREDSSQVASNEILDEAFVMASCEHTNLVRLLGISLSHQIMLITQLMPLGNLLEYVRDNKDNIGSQHLLNWSLQIAKGMRYLSEEKHLVHRDLAARNVLVKSPDHVRITDFGLAKLLDVNEDVYRAEGGKMPIKWLALESIQHRIFTQKSDVWSFGVTMWELMTFGKKPYENVPATDVHLLLEKGERLPQPHVCTIDIYMMLIKCWTVDAEARPNFRELTEELSKMARDPQRYLVVANDGSKRELPSPNTTEFLRALAHEEGDDFPITDAEEYLHPQHTENQNNGFHLMQPPSMVPWKRAPTSASSQQALLERRTGGLPSTAYDRRLDSVQTTMTNLSSISGSLPNGTSTPFASVTNPLTEFDEETEDMMLNTPTFHRGDGSVFNPRTISESSDVFSNGPMVKRDQYPPGMVECVLPDQHRPVRPREDSTNLRYSAEPVALHRVQTKPNGATSIPAASRKPKVTFQSDEDGYLSPTDEANQKPEYFDTSEFPPSPMSLHPPTFDLPTSNASSLANPEYEAAFPTAADTSRTPKKSLVDDEGYEIPLTANSDVEYENTTMPLTNHDGLLTLRHLSQSGDSSSSEKRDSGMQSDDDDAKKSSSAVANPNYDFIGDVRTGDVTPPDDVASDAPPEYVNTPGEQFKDDDIFTLLNEKKDKLGPMGGTDAVMRTYSEPDSGVGIEVAVDNLLYHKLGTTAWVPSD